MGSRWSRDFRKLIPPSSAGSFFPVTRWLGHLTNSSRRCSSGRSPPMSTHSQNPWENAAFDCWDLGGICTYALTWYMATANGFPWPSYHHDALYGTNNSMKSVRGFCAKTLISWTPIPNPIPCQVGVGMHNDEAGGGS